MSSNAQSIKLSPIASLLPTQKHLSLQVIVLEQKETIKTKDGHDITFFKVADATGSIQLNLYNDLGRAVRPSDVLRITNGYTNINRGRMVLCLAKFNSSCHKIGEFCMLFQELPDMSSSSCEFLKDFLNEPQQQQSANSQQPLQQQPPSSYNNTNVDKQRSSSAISLAEDRRNGRKDISRLPLPPQPLANNPNPSSGGLQSQRILRDPRQR